MHLNSWRAAGKKCRKRRPEGKWVISSECCITFVRRAASFDIMCACTLALEWQCMKIWRRRDGSKMSWKVKQREKNWTENPLKVKNDWMGKGEDAIVELWTRQSQLLCRPPVFGQQLAKVTRTERRLKRFIQQQLENMHKSSSHNMTKGFSISMSYLFSLSECRVYNMDAETFFFFLN